VYVYGSRSTLGSIVQYGYVQYWGCARSRHCSLRGWCHCKARSCQERVNKTPSTTLEFISVQSCRSRDEAFNPESTLIRTDHETVLPGYSTTVQMCWNTCSQIKVRARSKLFENTVLWRLLPVPNWTIMSMTGGITSVDSTGLDKNSE